MSSQPEYYETASLDEALNLLAELGPDARPLAGGTDLLLDLRHRRRQVSHLVGITRLPELEGIAQEGGLQIGAAAVLSAVEKSPLLRRHWAMLPEAAGLVGSRQVRNQATLGGNLCNALPCADTVPPLIAAGASAILASRSGSRVVPVAEVVTGQRRTILAPGELLVRFLLPLPPPRTGSAYLAHTTRRALDMTVVGVAASLTLDEDRRTIRQAALAYNNVAAAPLRVDPAAQALLGHPLSAGLLDEAANLAAAACRPRDSALRGSAAYRLELVRVLTRRCLALAYARAGGLSAGGSL